MTRRTLAVSFLLAFLAATPASASDVTVTRVTPTCTGGDECRYFMEQPYDTISLTGSPGERNVITARVESGVFVYRDDGAPIRQIGSCTRVDDHEVRCAGRYASVRGGDMNDAITVTSGITAGGGAGDDELNGGDGPDDLDGGSGNDRLLGNAGFDTLRDGDAGAANDNDVFDAGPNGGVVDYSASAAPVSVDLADPPTVGEGEAGENDSIVGATAVVGGSGGDDLKADTRGSSLSGGGGNDVLFGREGNDSLTGGAGRNTIEAGSGNDTIGSTFEPRGADRIACDDDRDVVESPRLADLVANDCERIDFAAGTAANALPFDLLGDAVARVDLFSCLDAGRPSLELRVARNYRSRGLPRAGTLLGRRTATRRACRGRPRLSVRLSATGRRLLKRHKTLPVEVRVNDPGNAERYTTELSAPGEGGLGQLR